MCESMCEHERSGTFTFMSRNKITNVVFVLLSVGPSNFRKASLSNRIILDAFASSLCFP